MRRDMDLIREMVLAVEDHPHGYAPDGLTIEGYTPEQIGYHSYLMVGAGLAKGLDETVMGCDGPMWVVTALTPLGHDFAEKARNPHIWDEARSEMKDKGIVAGGIDILLRVLDRKTRKHLDLD